MAEGAAGAYPQVFVVDSQASYSPLPSGKNPRWARVSQKLLLLLVGLALFGVVVEGCLTYYLYNKTENLSSTKTSHEQGGAIMSRMGPNETNEIPMPTRQAHQGEIQQRPCAHLMGSGSPVGETNVVQWVHTTGDAFTYNMGYNDSRLLVHEEGYYYLYSKLFLNAAEECSIIKHKVMKDTRAYGKPLELMKSKRYHCPSQRGERDQNKPGGEDLWNSFLGGVFHLRPGDAIFVTLENGIKMRLGTADNFMGAFMI